MISIKNLTITIFLVLLVAYSSNAHSSIKTMPDIEFSSNPIHGLYNFVQGLSLGPGGTSRSLTDIYEAADLKSLGFDKAELQQFLERYRRINVSYDYAFSEEVEHRHNKRQVTELLVMASSQASSIDDFAQRIMGILTNDDLMTLIETMKAFEPVYQKLIWQPAQDRFQQDLIKLNARAKEVDFAGKFAQASKFYNANWKAELPFKVYMAPIPSESGYTTATPQGNIISYVTAYINDVDGILAVVFHELAHLLYANQPIEFQAELESDFLGSDSYHKAHAYQLFNESMATAIGNGWFYKEASGKLDSRDWYYSPFINQQAKSIYPIVESYLKSGKELDQGFVKNYLENYALNFPKAYLEPDSFLSNVTFLADKDFKDHNKLFQLFFQEQQSVRSLNVQTPFFDSKAMYQFNNAINAKMIVLTKDHKKNLIEFQNYYPWLESVDFPQGEFVMYNFLADGTMLLIANLNDIESISKAIKVLKQQKVLEEGYKVLAI